MASALQPSATTTRRALLVVEGFVAAAVLGGIGLAATHGLGLSDRVLASTPFDRWVVLGVALAVIVGGAQLAAAWALAARRPSARILSFAAGGVLVAWIFGELAMPGLPPLSLLDRLHPIRHGGPLGSNPPARNPTFTGRGDLLDQRLHPSQAAAVVQVQAQALHGLGRHEPCTSELWPSAATT